MAEVRAISVMVPVAVATPYTYSAPAGLDLAAGGGINGFITGLNKALDITVPAWLQEGGTLVIPGHGRIGDEAAVHALLARAAESPNVVVKLSGLNTAAAAGWTGADFAPYVDHALACFGANRTPLYWITFTKRAARYRQTT